MSQIRTVAELLDQWSGTTLSDNEVTLADFIEAIRRKTGRFVLKKPKQYSTSFVVWDQEKKDVAAITHAYVVRYSTQIQTGNFVPEGKTMPEGMMDYIRKTEPSNMAQISVTFDVRMDDHLLEMINVLEDWIVSQSDFDPGQRTRNPWMSPTYISNNMKFTVTSQLFQSKNSFNCKDGGYKVDYPVHGWIAENSVPHNPLWVPNPNVVQFYDVDDTKVRRMSETNDPELHPGDVLKMTSKLVVSLGREHWNSSFVPWVMLRVGRLDKVDLGPTVQGDDPRPSYLPKDGDIITLPGRKRERSGDSSDEASPAKVKRVTSGYESPSEWSQLSADEEQGGSGDEDLIEIAGEHDKDVKADDKRTQIEDRGKRKEDLEATRRKGKTRSARMH